MEAVLHPAYFPPVTHFVAIATHSIVFETKDHYQKQTYRNRACVQGPNGKQLLTVPIKHTGKDGHQYYKDVKITYDFDWRKQHQKTLETIYRASPFFEFYEDEIMPVFRKKYTYLIEFNLETIQLVCRCLQLDFNFVETTLYETIINNALDLRVLSDAKTAIPFALERYDQVFQEKHGFMANLSILDLLFNKGSSAVSYLSRQKLSNASTGK
ncbi:MAG: WbqC family protein [Bacteroidota bacterium]